MRRPEAFLRGNLANTGMLTINRSTSYDAGGTVLANQGLLKVADGATLSVLNGAAVQNLSGGSIAGGGTGRVFAGAGTSFVQYAGTTSGPKPVVVDDAALSYTGAGASSIALRGTSTLAGNMAAGQKLTLESQCGPHNANVTAGSFTNAGTIVLTNDNCGDNDVLALSGGTLTNMGTLQVLRKNGRGRQIQGDLTSSGALGGTASLHGKLTLKTDPSFSPGLGSSFGIIGAGTRAGTFAKVVGAILDKPNGVYFAPTYGASAVTLVVQQATVSAPASAPRGSVVAVSGSGWIAGEKVAITFTDSLGVKTTYPAVTVDGTGSFSTNITIPAGAATGNGKITARSKVTSLSRSKTINVT
jgi:hypothetical protein